MEELVNDQTRKYTNKKNILDEPQGKYKFEKRR